MEELKLMVPTYNGKWLKGTDIELADFDEPLVPVLVHQAEGVRIALGTHDHPDYDKPDIQIERRHNGWMIFLRPLGGSDESGSVVFLDDGRSFVVKENGYGPTDPIAMVDHAEATAELDDILPSGLSCTPTMVVEKAPTDIDTDCDQTEPTNRPMVAPPAVPHFQISEDVIDALESAEEALVGDSNDDEHDALLALVEALNAYRLAAFRDYCPEWIVSDFCGWAGLDSSERPQHNDIENYVREARPADSSPLEVNRVLCDWADALARKSAEQRP